MAGVPLFRKTMYTPRYFEETDWPTIQRFIQEFNFGLLVTTEEAGLPTGTHLPLELVPIFGSAWALRGHLARANRQWRTFESGTPALAVFAEPHAYVSSSWYNHLNVPTWNYLAVHVYGPVRIVTGDELVEQMRQQVSKYEAGRPGAFSMDQFSAEELKTHLAGLVGFELTIETVQAKAKLSQNRDAESYRNIVGQLAQSDDQPARRIAEEMQKRRPDA